MHEKFLNDSHELLYLGWAFMYLNVSVNGKHWYTLFSIIVQDKPPLPHHVTDPTAD